MPVFIVIAIVEVLYDWFHTRFDTISSDNFKYLLTGNGLDIFKMQQG